MAEKNREQRIKKEIAKYKKIFIDMEPDRKKAVEKLIENVAFMAVTLEDLQAEINEKGCIEEYCNGENQYGFKESTAIKVYNSLIKNYNVSLKQLTDQLPKNEPPPDDGFEEFITKKSSGK